MARFKHVADDEIVEAALDALRERGIGLTLAEVGEKVGLSAATVVQRFGSKRELMLRVVKFRTEMAADTFSERDGQPLDRLLSGLVEFMSVLKTPEHVANMAAALHSLIADPEFHEVINAAYNERRRVMAQALDEAVNNGQVKPCDTLEVARLLQVTALGAAQSWAIEPDGELIEWVERCVRSCMAPWRIADDDLTSARA